MLNMAGNELRNLLSSAEKDREGEYRKRRATWENENSVEKEARVKSNRKAKKIEKING